MIQFPVHSLRALFGNAVFYTGMHFMEALVPMLLVPLLTRTLTPEEYGTWILFISISTFLIPVVGLKLEDALRMRFLGFSHEHRMAYFSAVLVLITLTGLGFLVISLLFQDTLEILTRFPGHWFWSTVVVAMLYAYLQGFLAFYQFSRAMLAFGLLQFLKTISMLLLSVAAVLIGWSWQGLIMAKVIGLGMTAILATYWLLKKFRHLLTLHKEHLKELFYFGLRFFPSGTLIVMIPLTDNLFLAHYAGLEDTGFFATGNLFASVLYLVIRGFQYAWQPWLFNRLDEENTQDQRLQWAIIGYYLLLPLGGAMLYFVSDFIAPLLIGSDFHKAFDYIFWMIVAIVFNGLVQFNFSFIHYTKKVGWMSICSLIAALSNILFNFWLIPEYGGIGAAYGTILAYASAALVSMVVATVLVRNHMRPRLSGYSGATP